MTWDRSRTQSCDPFDQHRGSRALAGPMEWIACRPRLLSQEWMADGFIYLRVPNRYKHHKSAFYIPTHVYRKRKWKCPQFNFFTLSLRACII